MMIIEDTRTLSTARKLELMADELGVNFQELVEEDARIKIAEAEAKEAARIEAERKDQEAAAARARDMLARLTTAGVVVAFVDGEYVKDIQCPHGGEMALAPVALKALRTRQVFGGTRMLPGQASTDAVGALAAERVVSVPCTCEKGAHEVRLFISSAPMVQ